MHRDRIGVALACMAALTLAAPPATADDPPAIGAPLRITGDRGQPLAQFEQGAAEGPEHGSLYMPQGDLYARNIQGTGPALDIGGGSTQNPGAVNVNYDVGNTFVVFDGHYRPMLVVTARGVRVRTLDGHLRWIR